MRKILALDSSTRVGSVALLDGEELIAEYTLGVQRTHAERLMPAVVQVITDAGWQPQELEGLVVATGPGSFTGLRIAVTTAKALAYALGLPVVGISTLDALAWGTGARGWLVSPLLNARRQQVYTSLYWLSETHELRREADYQVIEVEKWLSWLREQYQERILFVGEGAQVYAKEITTIMRERGRIGLGIHSALRAGWLGVLGARRLVQGERDDPFQLKPLYVRPPEAEVRLGTTTGFSLE